MKVKHVLFFFALMAAASQLQAQATLSVQGTIQRSFGGAVDDGKYALTFKLYTAETGGTPVWSETQDNIEVIGGVYSALLGEANPLTAGFNEVYYLGIAVDGGAELIPRTRLTSAPYALSLIGQSNTFPSAGSVGVGTVTPQAKLHVNNSDGDAVQFITAPNDNNANLRLSTGNHTGYLNVNQYAYQIGSENKSINIVPAGSGGRVHLYGNGGLKTHTDDDGLVVVGRLMSSTVKSVPGTDLQLYRGNDDLHIKFRGDGWTEMAHGTIFGGQTSFYFGNPFFYSVLGLPQWILHGPSNHGMAIIANANVSAPSFFTLSDRRIKKDLQLCPGKDALATLMQLEVTNYRHVDTLAKGSGAVTGFIAQQVAKVFPQAVTVETNSIPDIYGKPVSIQLNGSEAAFRMAAAHNLVAGDKVNIIQDGGERKVYEVLSAEGTSFSVKDWNASFSQPEKVFVYGKEVNDFCQVDYDKIHNLNVSATQELARRVAELEAANAGLMEKNNKLQQQNEGLRGDVNGLSDRLTKLENLLMSNGKR
jgi:hypothetical protein